MSSEAGNLTVSALVRAALGAVAIYDRDLTGMCSPMILGARDLVLLCSQPLALCAVVHQDNIMLL